MPMTVKDLLKSLCKPPEAEPYLPSERDQFLQPWGFTIYRTFYGPGSDQQWEKLLQNATKGAEVDLKQLEGASHDPAETAKLWGLFKLDGRSDATLDGLTLDEARQLYLDRTGGLPMNFHNSPYRIFAIADAEVLADTTPSVLKIVAADYDAGAAVPRNSRCGPQRYFGWMRMPATAILGLWEYLDDYFLEEIINKTKGGPGVFWDPYHDVPETQRSLLSCGAQIGK